MSQNYVESPYYGQRCSCGAHSQHRLLAFRFFNSGATLKDASEALHFSYGYTRLLATRLRRRKDRDRLCPLCGSPTFFSNSCESCGFTAGADSPTAAIDPEASSPVHRLLPNRGLGGYVSRGNYVTLARKMYRGEDLSPAQLNRHAANLSHLVEPRQDRLLVSVLSRLLQELKADYPEDIVSDVAAKLASEEVKKFRTNYSSLRAPKGLCEQLVSNVLRRMEVLYPRLPRQVQHRNPATSSPREESE